MPDGNVTASGNIDCGGTISSGNNSYVIAGQLRIGCFDTGNT